MMQKLRMIAGSVRPALGACAELTMTFRVGTEPGSCPAAHHSTLPRTGLAADSLQSPQFPMCTWETLTAPMKLRVRGESFRCIHGKPSRVVAGQAVPGRI